MRSAAYIGWLCSTAIALAAVAAVFSILVDPYRMYGNTLGGLTALKPRVYDQIGIAKTYQLERIAPRTVLLGNSRVEIGIDPQSPVWPSTLTPVFDAAEAGRGMFTSLFMIREAEAVRPLKLAVLGLDFQDFLAKATPRDTPFPPISADERRLLVDRNGQPDKARRWQIWSDRLATTLTIDAVLDSLDTLFNQNPETATTMTTLGFNPLHEYRVYVARSGYNGLFAERIAAYATQYERYPVPDFTDPYSNESVRYLSDILKFAADHKVPLILYIHPYHAEYLKMLRQMGFWQSFETWKHVLVRLLAQHESETGIDVPLFDFSGYNSYTTEDVPPPGDRRSIMHWYWEAGHYKSQLGDRMLPVMLDGATDFGRRLTAANIDESLADIRAARTAYLSKENDDHQPADSGHHD